MRIEAVLKELELELLHCFTQAADCREHIEEYISMVEQYDDRVRYIRGQIDRLRQDLVVIAIEDRRSDD